MLVSIQNHLYLYQGRGSHCRLTAMSWLSPVPYMPVHERRWGSFDLLNSGLLSSTIKLGLLNKKNTLCPRIHSLKATTHSVPFHVHVIFRCDARQTQETPTQGPWDEEASSM